MKFISIACVAALLCSPIICIAEKSISTNTSEQIKKIRQNTAGQGPDSATAQRRIEPPPQQVYSARDVVVGEPKLVGRTFTVSRNNCLSALEQRGHHNWGCKLRYQSEHGSVKRLYKDNKEQMNVRCSRGSRTNQQCTVEVILYPNEVNISVGWLLGTGTGPVMTRADAQSALNEFFNYGNNSFHIWLLAY